MRLSRSQLYLLLAFLSVAVGFVTNVATNQMPSWIQPHLWLSWPVLGVLAFLFFFLSVYQAREESPPPSRPAEPLVVEVKMSTELEETMKAAAPPPPQPYSAQSILTKYNGKRVMANKPNEPPQFFVYKGKLCHLSEEAARLLDNEKIGIGYELLEPEEEFILNIPELRGVTIGSQAQMEGILKEVRWQQTATRAGTGGDKEHLRELIVTKRRRLHELELQAAKFGISTPPHITIEIEDLRREIAELEAQLKS